MAAKKVAKTDRLISHNLFKAIILIEMQIPALLWAMAIYSIKHIPFPLFLTYRHHLIFLAPLGQQSHQQVVCGGL